MLAQCHAETKWGNRLLGRLATLARSVRSASRQINQCGMAGHQCARDNHGEGGKKDDQQNGVWHGSIPALGVRDRYVPSGLRF